jgi:hypothetical protein
VSRKPDAVHSCPLLRLLQGKGDRLLRKSGPLHGDKPPLWIGSFHLISLTPKAPVFGEETIIYIVFPTEADNQREHYFITNRYTKYEIYELALSKNY